MTLLSPRWSARCAPLLVALVLAGCSATGVDYSDEYADEDSVAPSQNFTQGLMAALGAVPSTQNDIDYTPGAPLVVPPSTATLVEPESPRTVETVADWPVDNDLEMARLRREAEVREAARDVDDPVIMPSELMSLRGGPMTEEDYRRDAASRLYADDPAMQMRTVDRPAPSAGEGAAAPVRTSLTSPPVEYLQPAPGAPAVIVEEDDGWF